MVSLANKVLLNGTEYIHEQFKAERTKLMRKIRYIKTFLVIGVIAALGLCALMLISQTNQPRPSSGARLILKQVPEGDPCL